jgi:hypothetical protein
VTKKIGPCSAYALGTGPNGDTLFPTENEARELAEAARKQAESGRAEERAARERLEAELAQIRAELARGKKRRG